MVLMGLLVVGYGLAGVAQGFQPLAVPASLGLLGLFTIALRVGEGFLAEIEVSSGQVRVKRWGSWADLTGMHCLG